MSTDYVHSPVHGAIPACEPFLTVTRDASPAHCYGTDAADGSGLINKLTPDSYASEAEAALMAAACAGGPGAEHLLPDDIGRLLVLYDGRYQSLDANGELRLGINPGGADTSKPIDPKMRWSAAVVAALIAVVVVAALCADIFMVSWTPLPVANGGSGCPDGTQLHGDLSGTGIWSCEISEFVPRLPRRMWIGPVVPVGWDCRYFGKATALRNWAEVQCIDAQFHAGDLRP